MTEVNLNQAECLKAINNFGNTVYQNVCNGTYTQVPWGSGDWLVTLFLIGIIVSIVWFTKNLNDY